MPDDNGWGVWAKRVLGDIERVERKQDRADDEIKELRSYIEKSFGKIEGDIKMLYFKCGTWGALGGIITAALALAATYIGGKRP